MKNPFYLEYDPTVPLREIQLIDAGPTPVETVQPPAQGVLQRGGVPVEALVQLTQLPGATAELPAEAETMQPQAAVAGFLTVGEVTEILAPKARRPKSEPKVALPERYPFEHYPGGYKRAPTQRQVDGFQAYLYEIANRDRKLSRHRVNGAESDPRLHSKS